MKNRKCTKCLYVAALFFISIFLSACQSQAEFTSEQYEQYVEQTIIQPRQEEIRVESQIEIESDYYFSKLQSEQYKETYNQIYEALRNRDTEIHIENINTDTYKFLYRCVNLDKPELFYVDSKYVYMKYIDENKIIAYPQYNMTIKEQEQAQKEIDVYVEKVLKQIDDSMTAYEKEKVIYDYIAGNTKYLTESENNQNMYSVVQGESVCLGYSKMFQYLCKQVDIPCTIITGTNKDSIGHAWNCVYINNDWYMVDCTNSVGQLTDTEDEVSYYFFNITKEQLLRTNAINNIVESPDCDSLEQEYYFRNGLYYSEIDTKRLEEQIKQTVESGKDTLTIRCGSSKVLNGLYGWLIDERNIFNIIGGGYQINYVKSNELLIMQISWRSNER